MKLLKFFYGMHLSYKLFSTIGGDFTKKPAQRQYVSHEGQRIAQLST